MTQLSSHGMTFHLILSLNLSYDYVFRDKVEYFVIAAFRWLHFLDLFPAAVVTCYSLPVRSMSTGITNAISRQRGTLLQIRPFPCLVREAVGSLCEACSLSLSIAHVNATGVTNA